MNEESLFKFLEVLYPDLIMSGDLFSPYDCLSLSQNMYIELKCRKTHYDKLLIEKSKYDRLINQAQIMDMIPVYICSTPNGIWGFSLRKFTMRWEMKELPTTTEFENTNLKQKTVGYLNVTDGKKFA